MSKGSNQFFQKFDRYVSFINPKYNFELNFSGFITNESTISLIKEKIIYFGNFVNNKHNSIYLNFKYNIKNKIFFIKKISFFILFLYRNFLKYLFVIFKFQLILFLEFFLAKQKYFLNHLKIRITNLILVKLFSVKSNKIFSGLFQNILRIYFQNIS